ncbi:ferrochelatase [Ramlibacter tataouinensis]|uniref:Ferrochelatase n=1 Tax=Ramlibacter tataouinensis (strain ATCC BAA-407 / DSM 14655 / LMG 21543 / TTB310) TaxID=365046 RepID=F5Y5G5_RAMTT|nr:ferrochelatase [Ramlibacter tataouinensis]AEG92661.1 Heme synthetase [Ramlibacter tataouinensis TTB310]
MAFASRFRPEPSYTHGKAPTTAVLLCNLGTPDAPTAPAVRRYLAQFLSDQRVVEIPRALWLPILWGIILPLRPAKSARKYASIWAEGGSPLRLWTDKQAKLLHGFLGERGHAVTVRYAMRYGHPSIEAQLDALKAQGVTRILVVPAYPQYSGTTTASLVDAVSAWSQRTRNLPELRFINRYHDDAGYIDALAGTIGRHWMAHGRPDHFVMSFHGVPERTLRLGDPYHCECHKTARLLAARLNLSPEQYTVSFQSRFGKAKWLEPYTEPTLRALAARGVKRVDVACPGFTSDCLETLEEIAMEGRAAFLAAGGQAFHAIPCLNDDNRWIKALADLAEKHLAGWPTRERPDPAALAQSRERAKALGASA